MPKKGRRFSAERRSKTPLFRVCGNDVYGLTETQIAEWHRDLTDIPLRKKISLQEIQCFCRK